MGLITKIIGREESVRVLPGDVSLDVSHLQPGHHGHTVCPERPDGPDNPKPLATSIAAAPCPTCRSPSLWFDVYGGGPHCVICRPFPTKSLVSRVREVIALADGSFAWSDESAVSLKSPIDLDREFESRYRCYVTRDGTRNVIERRDWSFLNSGMIVDWGMKPKISSPRDYDSDDDDDAGASDS